MARKVHVTAEEQLACELINYIEAKPEHLAGLCRYLSGKGIEDLYPYYRYHRPLIRGCPYVLIAMVRERELTNFGPGNYVCEVEGPHRARLAFAAALLKLVESGRLRFKPYLCQWELRRC
jgi:hypothetical protein